MVRTLRQHHHSGAERNLWQENKKPTRSPHEGVPCIPLTDQRQSTDVVSTWSHQLAAAANWTQMIRWQAWARSGPKLIYQPFWLRDLLTQTQKKSKSGLQSISMLLSPNLCSTALTCKELWIQMALFLMLHFSFSDKHNPSEHLWSEYVWSILLDRANSALLFLQIPIPNTKIVFPHVWMWFGQATTWHAVWRFRDRGNPLAIYCLQQTKM